MICAVCPTSLRLAAELIEYFSRCPGGGTRLRGCGADTPDEVSPWKSPYVPDPKDGLTTCVRPLPVLTVSVVRTLLATGVPYSP